jgi:hypothetical protein
MSNPPKIDAKGCLYWARNSGVHRFYKRLKHRFERRKAKIDPENPTYNKHKGWEL